MLNNFPSNLHPMAQFSAAITACNSESKYAKAYADGVKKALYWEVSLSWRHTWLELVHGLVEAHWCCYGNKSPKWVS